LALRITEIFYSLQGEASRVGLPTIFVRLTGCPLRCVWCDTEYSFTGGAAATIESVLAEVAQYPARQVCVTGGEPLSQKECLPLLSALCDAGYDVSLETSGALDISAVDPRVSRIMDLKAPDSGESDKNLWANLEFLNSRDEIKIVIASLADYEWARAVLGERQLTQCCPVLFSPAQGQIEAADLARWILEDGLPIRFQLQLHKLLWGNMRGK
jgi:7-carboxy-7-deazaguanine synthase